MLKNFNSQYWTPIAAGGLTAVCLVATFAAQAGPQAELVYMTPMKLLRHAKLVHGIYAQDENDAWFGVYDQSVNRSSRSVGVYKQNAVAVSDVAPPQQIKVAKFIADEWNLSLEYTLKVVHTVYQEAKSNNLDPTLLLAMAGQESSFRHVGNPGGGHNPSKPFGIMQVAGRWHPEQFSDGVVKATSLTENIKLGAVVYKEYLEQKHGDEKLALLQYNGSLHKSGKYARGVHKIQKKLKKALALSTEPVTEVPHLRQAPAPVAPSLYNLNTAALLPNKHVKLVGAS